MARTKINYKEGSCIAIPLRQGGYARGIVARINKKGKIFGYFFGPKFRSLEDIVGCQNLKYTDAIFVGRFGDLGLLNKEWKVIGTIPHWNREEWPLTAFIRIDEFTNRAWLSYYDENDLSCIGEEEVSPKLKDKYPYDSFMGYGAVEIELTELLA